MYQCVNSKTLVDIYYRPQLRKGNVFTGVSQEFCPQGVSASGSVGVSASGSVGVSASGYM